MTENVDNLILEHLKKIQVELASVKRDTGEIKSRMSGMESAIAKISRDEAANFGEIIHDRHAVDRLAERIDRIEQRLELQG